MAKITQPTTATLNPFADLESKVRVHWQEYRPAMYAKLHDHLDELIELAVEKTLAEVHELEKQYTEQGAMATLLAWEAVREKYALLPSEIMVPDLPAESDPSTWELKTPEEAQ